MSCARARAVDLAAFSVERDAAEWAEFRDHYPRCSDCSREVARWSKLAAVLQNPGPEVGSGHPPEEQLLAYQTQPSELEPAQRSLIESHLAGCGACRSELAVLRSFDFDQLELPVRASREASSACSRVVDAINALAQSLFGAVPRPALALMVLLVFIVPAGFVMWRILLPGGVGAPDGAPIAQVEESAPEARVVEPDGGAKDLQVAEDPSAPSAAEDPVEPGGIHDALDARRLALEEELETQTVAPDLEQLSEAIVAVEERDSQPVVPPVSPQPTLEAPPVPESPDAESPELRAFQIAALIPSTAPLYRADPLLAGGSLEAIRGGTLIRAGAGALPDVRALGPEHVGATVEPSPTLYWFLGGASDVPLEITLGDAEAVEPLLELRIEPPVRAGLHALRLDERGVRLAPGVIYDWFVTLVPDPEHRDADVISGAAIRRAPAGADFAARLEAAAPAEKAHVLAAFGYWYDAFDVLSGWIEAEPDADVLRRHRTVLLEQVGLPRVAQELASTEAD
jgi:anti-sigma factor RsiW